LVAALAGYTGAALIDAHSAEAYATGMNAAGIPIKGMGRRAGSKNPNIGTPSEYDPQPSAPKTSSEGAGQIPPVAGHVATGGEECEPNPGDLTTLRKARLRGINAEAFKADIVGKGAAARFNIAVGPEGQVRLVPVEPGATPPIDTGYTLDELGDMYGQ
jgi:hypothetical protein